MISLTFSLHSNFRSLLPCFNTKYNTSERAPDSTGARNRSDDDRVPPARRPPRRVPPGVPAGGGALRPGAVHDGRGVLRGRPLRAADARGGAGVHPGVGGAGDADGGSGGDAVRTAQGLD